MSGVVSPVFTWSSDVVTPSVPIEAERCPPMRQIWRVISTVEVLPLVPVTATTVVGIRRVEFRRQLGEAGARLGVGDVRHVRHLRLGPGDDRDRAAGHRFADEILAVEGLAAKGAEHAPLRDLAMVDGKAGDVEIASDVRKVAKAHRASVLRLVS